jgi:N-acetylglucosamine kinase-like BadF-type ATPase
MRQERRTAAKLLRMDFLVGIDGGGTKTECLIAALDGAPLGRAVSGASSLMHCSPQEVERHLGEAIHAASQQAGVGRQDVCRAVCGGFAAAGRSSVRLTLQQMLQTLLPRVPQIVLPDVRIAFEGATDGQPGVVVIAGTGSIALGRTDSGEEKRAGGWGPDISDEGSGYTIGRMATAAVLESFDGRRPPTLLRDLLLKQWNVQDEDGIIERMRRPSGVSGPARRPPFGELLPGVLEAAGAGDAAALEILRKAGRDLAALALHVVQSLAFSDPPLICTAGGVFRHSPQVEQEFARVVSETLPEATVEPARHSPVDGAILLARSVLSSSTRSVHGLEMA